VQIVKEPGGDDVVMLHDFSESAKDKYLEMLGIVETS